MIETDRDALDATLERRLTVWIERMLACRVVGIEREQRWRPSWYVDVGIAGGEARAPYVRGDRLAVGQLAGIGRESLEACA